MATKIGAPKNLRAYSPAVPLYNDTILLGDATAESWTVPAGVDMIGIEPTAAIWVNAAAAATVPAGDVTDGSASFRVSTLRFLNVGAGQVLSLIREGASAVTVSLQCYEARP